MLGKKRKTSTEQPWEEDYWRARKKTAKMSSGELLQWSDVTGTEILWHLQEYKKTGNLDCISEVQHGVVQLHALVDELYSDYTARNVLP